MNNPNGLENIDLDNWPHKFTKNGSEKQIDETKVEGSNNLKVPVYSIPMICICCHKEYLQGIDQVPPGPCPARNGKQELKRILNNG